MTPLKVVLGPLPTPISPYLHCHMWTRSLSHTQTRWINFLGPPGYSPTQQPEAATTVRVESWVKFSKFTLIFSQYPPHTQLHNCSMKQKIQFSSLLWGLMFLPICIAVDVLLETGTFRPGGSITWQKLVCVFDLGGSVETFIMCGVEQ